MTTDSAVVEDLIERSSLGTPGAKQLRARASAVLIQRVLERSASLIEQSMDVAGDDRSGDPLACPTACEPPVETPPAQSLGFDKEALVRDALRREALPRIHPLQRVAALAKPTKVLPPVGLILPEDGQVVLPEDDFVPLEDFFRFQRARHATQELLVAERAHEAISMYHHELPMFGTLSELSMLGDLPGEDTRLWLSSDPDRPAPAIHFLYGSPGWSVEAVRGQAARCFPRGQPGGLSGMWERFTTEQSP